MKKRCLTACYDVMVVGVEVSPAEIKAVVADVINVNKELLLEQRYRVNGESMISLSSLSILVA